MAEALGAGRARAPRERRHRPLVLGRQQPAPCRRPAGARLRRRALGHLPPDPGPGRTGAKRRAWHPHPLVPGPPEDRRQRRARPAQEGRRRQARLPPRAPAHARRPAVHRVQRRAGRRAAGPADAHCRAALEGAPERREGPRGQRGPRPSRGRRPRVLQPEPRRDRAARARTVPLREPLLPDRAPRAGAQHRPSGTDEPRHAHPRDRRRVRLTGLCEGGAPRGDQRHDDGRARGRGPRPEPGAAYVEGWVAALEEDPREIRRAAADAQKISDFVLARSREREVEREPVAATRAPAREPALRPELPLPVPNRSSGPSR